MEQAKLDQEIIQVVENQKTRMQQAKFKADQERKFRETQNPLNRPDEIEDELAKQEPQELDDDLINGYQKLSTQKWDD